MSKVTVTMPDGTKYKLDGVDPNMSDLDIHKLAEKHHRKVSADIYAGAPDNQMILQSEKDAAAFGGGNDLSALKKFGLGAKHSLNRSWSGIKGLVTDLSHEDKMRLQQGDAFVNQHGGAASAGQFVGDLAPDIALAVATRGMGLGWRAGLQGTSSFLRTPGDWADRALAGGVSAAGEGVGQLLSSTFKGGAKAIEPFSQTGRDRIVNRTLNGAYTGEGDLLSAILRGNNEIIQGVKPTTAQAVLDPGISRMTDSMAAKFPDVGNAIKKSDLHRNTAYQTLMSQIKGTEEEIARFEAIRKAAAQSDFGAANATSLMRTPELDATAARLMGSPSVKESVPGALKIAKDQFALDAANNGKTFVPPAEGSVGGISYIAKDLSNRVGKAMSPHSSDDPIVLAGLRDSVVDYLRSASPLYANAVDNYAKNSRPINQMKVGNVMYEKAFPATVDESGMAFRMNKNSFLNAKRDADEVVKQATGLRNKSADEILEPWQTKIYDDIGKDVSRADAAASIGLGGGSQTAQRLSDAGALNPHGMIGNILRAGAYVNGGIVGGQAADSLMSSIANKVNGKISGRLGEAIVDPNIAASILRDTNMAPGFFLTQTSKNRGITAGLADATFNHMPNQFPWKENQKEQ